MITTNQTQMTNPASKRQPLRPVPMMINKNNLYELGPSVRPLSGKQTGFGSTLNKFGPGYGKSYFATTN